MWRHHCRPCVVQVLDVTGAVGVTDEGVQRLGQCHQLRTVVLTWCVQLTDRGLLPLAQGCGRLELLSLHGIRGITDRRGTDLLIELCVCVCR